MILKLIYGKVITKDIDHVPIDMKVRNRIKSVVMSKKKKKSWKK